MTRTAMRIGGALGIAHVVVVLTGFALYISYADPTKSLTERFVDSDATRIYTGGYLEVVGYLLFLPFASFVIRLLRSAESSSSFAADTAAGATAVYVATTLTPGLAAFGAATKLVTMGPSARHPRQAAGEGPDRRGAQGARHPHLITDSRRAGRLPSR